MMNFNSTFTTSPSSCTPFWANGMSINAGTSSVDWCEENYAITCHVAEYHNTMSSLAICAYGVFGMALALRQRLETRFLASFFSLFIVGAGSVLFHATLDFYCQMADELPMLYGVLIFFYCCVETEKKCKYPFLPTGLLGTMIFLTASMVRSHSMPLVFQCLWVFMMLVLVLKLYVFFMATKDEGARLLFQRGLVALSLGALCWLVDTHMCSVIDGLPLRDLFQLHAWWHIFSGYGCYAGILFGAFVRSEQHDSHRSPSIQWLAWLFPYLSFAKSA